MYVFECWWEASLVGVWSVALGAALGLCLVQLVQSVRVPRSAFWLRAGGRAARAEEYARRQGVRV